MRNTTLLKYRHVPNHIAGRTRALANLPARPFAVTLATLAGAWLLAALANPSGRLALAALLTILTAAALGRARRQPRLRVLYCGERVTVNEKRIQPHMEVPGDGGPYGYDNFGGPCAAALFNTAITHGAVNVPPQLRVECFANDTDGCGVMLTATRIDSRARVSTGWIDSASFGVRYSDEANDPQTVACALEFMVGEINRALHPAN